MVALVYHPPVAHIVIYHSQQVVWNLLPHHRLDADVPSRGIERIAYVNADQCAESLTLASSSSYFSGDVHHCLNGVNCGPAFPKAELVFRETILVNHVPCSLCRIISSRSFPIVSNMHIGLYDEASPRGLLPFLSRTNLCFFQSAENLPSRSRS